MPEASDRPVSTGIGMGDNVEKIREILFGGQLREYDRRLAELEQRTAADHQRIQDELSQRMTRMEGHLNKELGRIAESYQQERKERRQALQSFEKGLRELRESMDTRIAGLEEGTGKQHLELMAEISERVEEVRSTLRARHDELALQLERQNRRVEDEKTSRDELSQLFTELALRLRREFELPESQG